MVGFYERRKSKAAIWCLRLAVISVPFFILTIVLHRYSNITTPQAFWLIAFGIAMLLASLVFGLRASIDLWEKGYQGGRATVNGIVLSVILLIPFGIQLANALQYPQLNDVSTDVLAPPTFLAPVGAEKVLPPSSYDDFNARQIVFFYPELVSRRYNAPQERVVTSVLAILKQWGWRITASENLPPAENTEAKSENSEEELAGGAESAPGQVEIAADMTIQVEAKSFLLKLPSYFVIRLSPDQETTLVDVRSTSIWGKHDFGGNAKDVSEFLNALDLSLAGLAGEI